MNDVRHAVCDLCDNEAKGTKDDLIRQGWFMGLMGEVCPDAHGEEVQDDSVPEIGGVQ